MFKDKNSGISFLALIFNSSNLTMTILQAKIRFKIEKSGELYTNSFNKSIQARVLVAKASRSESGHMSSIQQGTETLCSPSGNLLGTGPVEALSRALLYCCAP